MKITPAAGKVSVEIDGKPFTDFYMSGEAFNAKVTKPYLWPLRAATGTYITRAWPMEDVAEEAAEKKPSAQRSSGDGSPAPARPLVRPRQRQQARLLEQRVVLLRGPAPQEPGPHQSQERSAT